MQIFIQITWAAIFHRWKISCAREIKITKYSNFTKISTKSLELFFLLSPGPLSADTVWQKFIKSYHALKPADSRDHLMLFAIIDRDTVSLKSAGTFPILLMKYNPSGQQRSADESVFKHKIWTWLLLNLLLINFRSQPDSRWQAQFIDLTTHEDNYNSVHFEDNTIKLGLGVAETHPQHISWVLCNPPGNTFTYLYFVFKQPDYCYLLNLGLK